VGPTDALEGGGAPVTLSLIVVLLAVFARAYQLRINAISVCFNYESVMHRKQFWRFISSSLYHESIYHLIFICLCLWSLRHIEAQHGRMFYISHTVLFIFSSRAICLVLASLDPSLRIRSHYLASVGFSDVVLAWTAYNALSNFGGKFELFGFLPISNTISPIVVFLILNAFGSSLNRSMVSHVGLWNGLCLAWGIDLIPTTYWAFVLIVDVLVLSLWSYCYHPNSSSDDALSPEEFVEAMMNIYRSASGSSSSSSSASAAQDGNASMAASGGSVDVNSIDVSGNGSDEGVPLVSYSGGNEIGSRDDNV
jgi:membrane associated rhomboid family serine protease